MAEKRMFAKTIIDSDAFLDMSLSTQALYFHLSMRADDDGFVNNPKKIQRMIGCGDDELKMLIAKKFLIPFESGVCVIKHWRIHNYIQSDRYHETNYKEEKAILFIDENKAYTLENTDKKLIGNKIINTNLIENTPCIQDVYNSDTQIRLDKNRLDKNRLDKNNNLLLFEQLGFGSINPIVLEDIKLLEETYTEMWVKEALKEANDQGVRNLKYVKGILKNWQTKGFKAEKPKVVKIEKANSFNNFKPRDYNYDDLEKKLLGWES